MQRRISKPSWLKVDIASNNRYSETKKVVDTHCLHTICSSGRCPNLGECWGKGTATFMIGGDICTRNCKFCNTKSGKPLPLNPDEPENIAKSIKLMQIDYAVITSVDRDDLPDYGANHWVKTIAAIKQKTPQTAIEVLIPDFQGDRACIDLIIQAKPHIIAHNMETIKRITPLVRSVAKYEMSLKVLEQIAASGIPAKSGIMVGLGETTDEVEYLMEDLLKVGCSILTIGQYLQPSRKHYPVVEYIHPEQFEKYKVLGIKKGFKNVVSGPLVRSSYHAEQHISLIP